MRNIIIATIKEWNIKNYFKLKESLKGKYNFYLITNKDELNLKNIEQINPQYIFFPHWSDKVEKEIYTNFESIIFHESNLPFGRGGSPIQNLIINKHYKTKISAIECLEIIDSGDIYLQEDFDLKEGNAQEIYENISEIVFHKMIPFILKNKPLKYAQTGEVVSFNRRTKEQSDLKQLQNSSLRDIYDFIRMLDADTYPKAFCNIQDYKVELHNVTFKDNKLIGKFTIDEKK